MRNFQQEKIMSEKKHLIKTILMSHSMQRGRQRKGVLIAMANCSGLTKKSDLDDLVFRGRSLGAPDLVYFFNSKAYCLRVEPNSTRLRRQKDVDERLQREGVVNLIIGNPNDYERLLKLIHDDKI